MRYDAISRPLTQAERETIPEHVFVEGELWAGMWQREWPDSRLIRIEVEHGRPSQSGV